MPRGSDAASRSFLKAQRHLSLTLHFAPRLTAGKSKETGRRWGWFGEGRRKHAWLHSFFANHTVLCLSGCERQTCSDLPLSFWKTTWNSSNTSAKFATNVLAARLIPQTGATGGRSAFITHQKLILEPFQGLRTQSISPKPSKAEEAPEVSTEKPETPTKWRASIHAPNVIQEPCPTKAWRDWLERGQRRRPTPHPVPSRWPLRFSGPGPCFGDFWLAELGVPRSGRRLPRPRSETGRLVVRPCTLRRLPFRSPFFRLLPTLDCPRRKLSFLSSQLPAFLLLYCWGRDPTLLYLFLGLNAPLASSLSVRVRGSSEVLQKRRCF